MIDYRRVLETLTVGGVDFIVLGGIAAVLHGTARATLDVDVVYSREASNLERVVKAVAPLAPYPRGAPPGLPFRWDLRTVTQGLNFTLDTTLGPLDLLGEVPGGTYATLAPHTIDVDLGGLRVRCVDLLTLIRLKRAAGRPKDYESIAELEALLAARERAEGN